MLVVRHLASGRTSECRIQISTKIKCTIHLQDRNAQHANGGAEASRLTAQARRQLAKLGTTVENLADKLESLSSV